ncbi:hypothetical protein ADUPG1_009161 [Aduncisulcus paluster]|uniref:60S acidic ribosomal protein P1 n=1 Tax=Aduncisulcus paluster TaxID=2918883 RepID=A0ABQ5KVW2_9EUKA|nr:hypothetical protein ADUPG1_009161 [Aduncisulcus paluster]
MSSTTDELACVYSALLLHDAGMEVSHENISNVLGAFGIEVASYWPKLFAQFFSSQDMAELVSSQCAVGASAGGAAAGGAAEETKEDAPADEEEEEEESSSEGGFGGLF